MFAAHRRKLAQAETDRTAADWEVYPTSPWNYGLVVDPKNFADAFTVKERPLAKQPFAAMDAPVETTVKSCRLPQWTLMDD